MTSALDSLPDRPLREREVTALNHSDMFSLVVPVNREQAVEAETQEPVVITEQLILGTENWIRALIYDDGWQSIETVTIDNPEDERFDAMQACKSALAAY